MQFCGLAAGVVGTGAGVVVTVAEVGSITTGAGAVGLVGSRAARAEPVFRDAGLATYCSMRPSPLNRASRRAEWEQIRTAGAEVRWALIPPHQRR